MSAANLVRQMVERGLTHEQALIALEVWEQFQEARGPRGVPRAMRLAVIERANGRCVYCGSTDNLQADHVVPYSRGGFTTMENLVCACRSCNCAKKDRTPQEWGARNG